MKTGNIGEPTTFCSVRPLPGNCVCFWRTSKKRCALTSPMMISGTIKQCRMKKRGMIVVPGSCPEYPERQVAADQRDRQDDRVRDADAGPGDQVVGQRVPEEAVHDRQDQQRRADDPVQFARLAEGTGEETRAMWMTIAPTKMSQAQWCICRIKRPPRTAKERFTVEANAWVIFCPSRGA